jgi:hypothetical protein
MPNGVAALHLVPAPESKDAAVGKPDAGIETAIGIAMAAAAEAFARALTDVEEGASLRAASRELGGERIAAVATIWLDHREIDDFRGLAQREGVRALQTRYGEALHQQLGADCSETAIAECFDKLCAWVTTVAGQVVATEMAFRLN